jgi:hypothetical protein
MSDFFFVDDMDDERIYLSVSVGEVWLYFYKEILIGVRDMPTKEDGYSHRHEITQEVVDRALKEPYPNALPIKYLPADELSALALQWVASGLIKHVDNALA